MSANYIKAKITTLQTDRIISQSDGTPDQTALYVNGAIMYNNPPKMSIGKITGPIGRGANAASGGDLTINDVVISGSTIQASKVFPIQGETLDIANMKFNAKTASINNTAMPIKINGVSMSNGNMTLGNINASREKLNIAGISIENGKLTCESIVVTKKADNLDYTHSASGIQHGDMLTAKTEELALKIEALTNYKSELPKELDLDRLSVQIFDTDAIFEKTRQRGVNIEGCLFKRGNVKAQTGSFEKHISIGGVNISADDLLSTCCTQPDIGQLKLDPPSEAPFGQTPMTDEVRYFISDENIVNLSFDITYTTHKLTSKLPPNVQPHGGPWYGTGTMVLDQPHRVSSVQIAVYGEELEIITDHVLIDAATAPKIKGQISFPRTLLDN